MKFYTNFAFALTAVALVIVQGTTADDEEVTTGAPGTHSRSGWLGHHGFGRGYNPYTSVKKVVAISQPEPYVNYGAPAYSSVAQAYGGAYGSPKQVVISEASWKALLRSIGIVLQNIFNMVPKLPHKVSSNVAAFIEFLKQCETLIVYRTDY